MKIITRKTAYMRNRNFGFTLVEVLIAASIMIILCVGLLTLFSSVIQRNRGENLRMQALSVLQKEVELYRSYEFIPVGTAAQLNEGTYNLTPIESADKIPFNISVVIKNLPAGTLDANCKLKEITLTASPKTAETGWLANLKTNVTIQRVRSN